MKNDARFLAHEILNQFNNKTKLDILIEKVLTKYNPNYLVRSRCRVIICDVIRLLGRIDFIIKIVSGKNKSKIINIKNKQIEPKNKGYIHQF